MLENRLEVVVLENTSSFLQLLDSARAYMESHGFSYTSVSNHMRTWRSVYNFALSKGINQYSAELAEQYMQEKYGISIGENAGDDVVLSVYMTQKIRALRSLTDFSLTGFVFKQTRGEKIIWSKDYQKPCETYMNHLRSLGYKDITNHKHELILHRFVCFLESNNIKLHELKAENIYEYFKTLTSYAKGHLANVRLTLVHALRDFYVAGFCTEDLSPFVPMVRYYSKSKIEKTWSENEITAMLDCIDRANPIGKRDYAIMLIAANLGLRTSDILSLTMDNFNWRSNELRIIQIKTNEPLSLPITKQIGEAVIDYWKNGRPDTVAKEIFVQHTLPFVYHIFNKYCNASGIKIPYKRQHGLHSLRHSLASRLLEKDIPVNVIGNILGHVDSNSAKNYIRIDIEKLRQCSLEVPEYE